MCRHVEQVRSISQSSNQDCESNRIYSERHTNSLIASFAMSAPICQSPLPALEHEYQSWIVCASAQKETHWPRSVGRKHPAACYWEMRILPPGSNL
jgi:hypothetical protein